MKPVKKIWKNYDARLKGYAALVSASKNGGKEYRKPGSRNPKKV
jgi:hypothetical protein